LNTGIPFEREIHQALTALISIQTLPLHCCETWISRKKKKKNFFGFW